MPVPYNKNFTTYKSTQLQGLDCQTTGQLVYNGDPEGPRFFNATFTAAEAMEQGECIAMVRVPRGLTVTDVLLTWTAMAVDAVIGVGDPFCCGRFLGPILANQSSGVHPIGTPQGTLTCIAVNRLEKIGRRADGCGYGYTYTCDTDIIITLGYGPSGFNVGGGGGETAGVMSADQGGLTFNSGVIPSGTVFGLKVEGYMNSLFTNPS